MSLWIEHAGDERAVCQQDDFIILVVRDPETGSDGVARDHHNGFGETYFDAGGVHSLFPVFGGWKQGLSLLGVRERPHSEQNGVAELAVKALSEIDSPGLKSDVKRWMTVPVHTWVREALEGPWLDLPQLLEDDLQLIPDG